MLKSFFKSLTNAIRGLVYVLRTQHNFRIQSGIGFIMMVFGVALPISLNEWLWLGSAILSVLVLEIINTAFEKMLDVMKPRLDERVGMVKDIMAAAVLLVSIGAFVIGLSIFLPRLVELIGR